MSRIVFAAVVAVGFSLPLGAPLMAHHSFSAEFDESKPMKVTGKLVEVQWTNPHIWYFVDGVDEVTGQKAVFGFSGGAPNSMRRRGLDRSDLKLGVRVIVEGFRARDGSANGGGRSATYADTGRSLFEIPGQ